MARRGISRSFQRTNAFLRLPVRENLRLAAAAQGRGSYDLLGSVDRLWVPMERARGAAEAVGLTDRLDVPAGALSYGEQRQLEIGIALATDPKLLLLDEPTAGMSPEETHRMTELLAGLPRAITLLIIEHDMDVVFTLADRITVLHYGEVLAEGTADEVRADPRVYEVYLGSGLAPERLRDAGPTAGPGPRTGHRRRLPEGSRTDARARGRGDPHLLRRQPRPPRRVAARRRGRGGGAARAERRRKDDADPQHHGVHAVQGRPHRARGRADPLLAGAPHREAGRGAGATGTPHLRAAHGAGEPAARRPAERPGRRLVDRACVRPLPASPGAREPGGGTLSGGEQQMLAVGRALLTNGRVLLLDEPSEGLAPLIVREIGRILVRLKTERLSILLIEQNYHLALAIADRVYVMSKGQIVWEGTPAALGGERGRQAPLPRRGVTEGQDGRVRKPPEQLQRAVRARRRQASTPPIARPSTVTPDTPSPSRERRLPVAELDDVAPGPSGMPRSAVIDPEDRHRAAVVLGLPAPVVGVAQDEEDRLGDGRLETHAVRRVLGDPHRRKRAAEQALRRPAGREDRSARHSSAEVEALELLQHAVGRHATEPTYQKGLEAGPRRSRRAPHERGGRARRRRASPSTRISSIWSHPSGAARSMASSAETKARREPK